MSILKTIVADSSLEPLTSQAIGFCLGFQYLRCSSPVMEWIENPIKKKQLVTPKTAMSLFSK